MCVTMRENLNRRKTKQKHLHASLTKSPSKQSTIEHMCQKDLKLREIKCFNHPNEQTFDNNLVFIIITTYITKQNNFSR